MTRLFVELPSFRNDWRALGLADGDLRRLQEELLTDPQAGRVMQGTGGIRKIRFAYEGRGKSGSIRVIYIDFPAYGKLYLLTAYAKNEAENLTKAERNELKKLVEILEQELRMKEEEVLVWECSIRSRLVWKRLWPMSGGRYEQRRPSCLSCLWTITKLMRSGRFGKARDLLRLFLHSIWVSV